MINFVARYPYLFHCLVYFSYVVAHRQADSCYVNIHGSLYTSQPSTQMSKRTYDDFLMPPSKRVHVCRKRSRDPDEIMIPRKRTCYETEIFQEANTVYNMPECMDNKSLLENNRILRFHLGKIARLGISLKMERDSLKAQVEYLLKMQKSHDMAPPLITVP